MRPESSDAHGPPTDNGRIMLGDLHTIVAHESGHAVVAARLGLPVLRVEIRRTTDGLLDGYCHVDYSRARPSAWVTVLMSGWAAEEVITGARMASRPHLGSDKDEIAAALMQTSANQRAMLMTTATQQATRLVKAHRPTIIRLAGALLEKAAMAGSLLDAIDVRIDGDQLYELLGGSAVAILRGAV